jgi:hypothetical protein
MALVNAGPIFLPALQLPGGPLASGLALGSIAFDSATDRAAWVGRAPVTDSLQTIYLRTGTVTTGCTLDVRVETVTNGRPSGTLLGTNTNASVVVDNADDNVWKTATLTAAASLTKGQEFAIVVVVSSGTPNMNLAAPPGSLVTYAILAHYPLTLQDTGGGTWATQGAGWEWIVQFASAGVVPLVGLNPTSGAGTITAFNSGTSPDERALRFQAPMKCRVAGLRLAMFNIAAGGDFTASLWDATGDVDGEALAQASIDGDFALSATQDGYVDLLFATPVELSAGTTYYAGVRADTANNIGLAEFSNANVTNALRGFQGVDASMYLSTRTWTAGAAGAWSDTTTTLPLIYLIVDQLDDGAGGGGSAAFTANTRGNMQ